MSQTLYRKYRPLKFSELKSQDHITTILKGQVEDGSFSHSYLFTGPRGCGKTSAARILARAINCKNQKKGEPCNECENCLSVINSTALDVIEIDAASNRSIDDVRDFKEKVNFQPVSFKKKVFIIDEVHMLTKEAFNALLKTLEEPPEFVVFILATTDIHKVPPTILSRCQRFEFHLAEKNNLLEKLKEITAKEGSKLSDDVLRLVIRQSGGSFRDSESILEKIIHLNNGGDEISLEKAQEYLGLTHLDNVNVIARSLIAKDFENAKNVFKRQVVDNGQNIEVFVSQLIEELRENFLELETSRVFEILRELFTLYSQLKHEDKKDLLVEITFYEICTEKRVTEVATASKEQEIITKDISMLLEESKSTVAIKNSSDVDTGKIADSSTNESKTEGKKTKSAEIDDLTLINLEKLQQIWLDFVNVISAENVHLGGYILNSRPYSVSGQIITVVVKYKLHKNLLEKYSSITLLNESLGKLFPEAKPMIFKFSLITDIGDFEEKNVIVNQDEILGDVLK